MKNLTIKNLGEEFPEVAFVTERYPTEMIWKPKEDITSYELALCMPYIILDYGVTYDRIDESLPHFRHFDIIVHK